MSNVQALSELVESYLGEINVKFGKTQNPAGENVYNIRTKMRGKIQTCQLVIAVRDTSVSVIAVLPLGADEDHRLAVAEYLTRCNYGLRSGNFELNMNDGEIRYKTFLPVAEGLPAKEDIKNTVLIPIVMIERFGDRLLEVLFDFKTPKEAYESIQ